MVSTAKNLSYAANLDVGRLMTDAPAVFDPYTKMNTAYRILQMKKLSGAPVVEFGYLTGIVTQKAMLAEAALSFNKVPIFPYRTIDQILDADPITFTPDESIEYAMDQFIEHSLEWVPIINYNHRLLGVFTLKSLLYSLRNLLR